MQVETSSPPTSDLAPAPPPEVRAMTELTVEVSCGVCGGPVFMVTCHCFHGNGHPWVVCSVCEVCRLVHWTSGCPDCALGGASND